MFSPISSLVDDAMGVPITLNTKPTARMRLGEDIGPNGPTKLALQAGEQYRFGFDARACIGCHSCEAACGQQNGLPAGGSFRRVGEMEGGTYPETKRMFISMACNHCVEPLCLQGCPTNAYVKLSNGIVAHQADECIGCQYCTWNCPYSVPAFQEDRRIVTKCDMCQPRLEAGFEPACVDACPTRAITVEIVNIEAWRADHSAGDAPGLPSSSLTLSTTRFTLPDNMPANAVAASDHRISPEHPHWPLVWLTLLSQAAVGTTVFVTIGQLRDRSTTALAPGGSVVQVATAASTQVGQGVLAAGGAVLAAVIAATALAGSLAHLGRPLYAWKALRNLRHSWLSREALLLGMYAGLAGLHAALAVTAERRGWATGSVNTFWAHGGWVALVGAAASLVGIAGVGASAALYIVPGRPSWYSSTTLAAFCLPIVEIGVVLAVLTGALPTAALVFSAAAVIAQVAGRVLRYRSLTMSSQREGRGSAQLLRHRFRGLVGVRAGAAAIAAAAALSGLPWLTLPAVLATEFVGRYLFYVTVVPLNMPGSFWRDQ